MLGFASLMLPRYHIIQPLISLNPNKLLAINSVQTEIGRLFVIIWAAGAAVSILKLIAGEMFVRRTLRGCRKLDENESRRLLSSVANVANRGQLPIILVSDENYGPCCWQLHRPTILLPSFLFDGRPNDLQHVLKHELKHLDTNDPLNLFLQRLAQTVCWFHPAMWTAACHASLAREYMCDDAASEDGSRTVAYLRTLLRIAERQCDKNNKLQNIGFNRSRSEIVMRVQRLTQRANHQLQRTRPWLLRKRMILGTIILLTCMMSQIWLPFDTMSSSRSRWSPWPTWTSQAGHFFGLNLRDYEEFDRRARPYELRCENGAI
jgi:beta-lactamase regulating signal transducer with metallopeptidase domain